MPKPPDWAMKFRIALNINEFTLFDMFQDPLRMQIQKEKIPATTSIKIPQSMSEFQTLETLNIYIYESSESAREWRTALIERRSVNHSVSLLPDWSIASFDGWLSPRLLHRQWMDTA